jgi:hypothetical protein
LGGLKVFKVYQAKVLLFYLTHIVLSIDHRQS